MIKPNVWINTGIITIYGASLDAKPHSHQAMQVIWPQGDCQCEIDNEKIIQPLIINSNIRHQLKMSKGWILLVEPKSNLGEMLSNLLNNQAFKPFTIHNTKVVLKDEDKPELETLLAPLFSQLNLPLSLLNNKSSVLDKRISLIISQLDSCLLGDCIKTNAWRASEVAKTISLSESRFLHLFSQETGIAWRPYLLWRRIICAIKAILKNIPVTDAAHIAGFSDSAHLSRTFKKTFGMTITQAKVLFTDK